MHRTLAAACLLLTLLVLPATGDLPVEAQFELDGVTYAYATGVLGTESVILGPGLDGQGKLDLRACAFVMMHPGTPNGRILIEGIYANVTPVQFSIENFFLPDQTLGYSYDVPIDWQGQPEVLADFLAVGNASMRAGGSKYYDPVSSQWDSAVDPGDSPRLAADRKAPKLLGSLFLTPDGIRDDVTGAMLDTAAPLDPEMHVRVESRPEATPHSRHHSFSSYGTPVPVGAPSEAFGAVHKFNNIKFGGTAQIAITTTANAPAGMNEFVFSIRDPTGAEIQNVTLTPAALADDTANVEFPLDAFGAYTIIVTGKVALGGYDIAVELLPPPDFELNMWWENVTYGAQAYEDYQTCRKEIISPNKSFPTQSIVRRPDPPTLALKLVIVGVVAGVGLVTIGVKLLSDQIAASAFRKSK